MKNVKIIVISAFLVALCSAPFFCLATTLDEQEKQTDAFTGAAGLNKSADVGQISAVIIETVLGLLGIIFIVLMVYAGFEWMTAAGNEEKVSKAKETIFRAIIGLIIVVSAYAITFFVFNSLNP